MNKSAVYAITIVVCLLLQLGLAPAIAIGGCTPCFLLIPVLIIAMRSGAPSASVAGFILGLIADFAGSGAIGCTALAFIIVAIIVGILCSAMENASPIMSLIVGVAAPFFFEIIFGVSSVLTNVSAAGAWSAMFGYALPSAFYTLVFACLGLVSMNLVIADDGPSSGFGGLGSSRGPSFPSTRYK